MGPEFPASAGERSPLTAIQRLQQTLQGIAQINDIHHKKCKTFHENCKTNGQLGVDHGKILPIDGPRQLC